MTFASFALLWHSHSYMGHSSPGVGGPILQAFALIAAWAVSLLGCCIVLFCLVLNWSEPSQDESYASVARAAFAISAFILAFNIAHFALKIFGPDI